MPTVIILWVILKLTQSLSKSSNCLLPDLSGCMQRLHTAQASVIGQSLCLQCVEGFFVGFRSQVRMLSKAICNVLYM